MREFRVSDFSIIESPLTEIGLKVCVLCGEGTIIAGQRILVMGIFVLKGSDSFIKSVMRQFMDAYYLKKGRVYRKS